MEAIVSHVTPKNNNFVKTAERAFSEAKLRSLLLSEENSFSGEAGASFAFSSLEADRPEAGAGGSFRPRSGESEGQSPSVLLVLEQLAGVSRQKKSKDKPVFRGKTAQKSKSIQACEAQLWSMMYMKKVGPDELFFGPFYCNSWRCDFCSHKVRKKNYLQMMKGFEENPGQYLFCVITYDQKRWGSEAEAYKALSRQTNKLVKRIEREFGHIIGVITVEEHVNRFPHVNLVFKFKDDFIMDAEWVKKKFEKRFLKPNAVGCGFGRMATADLINPDEVSRVLSYVSKTGMSLMGGELNKHSQIPLSAPKGFRRIRSLRGFLKSVKKESEYTGEIVKSEIGHINSFNEAHGPGFILERVIEKYPQAIFAGKVSVTTDKAQERKKKIRKTNFNRFFEAS